MENSVRNSCCSSRDQIKDLKLSQERTVMHATKIKSAAAWLKTRCRRRGYDNQPELVKPDKVGQIENQKKNSPKFEIETPQHHTITDTQHLKLSLS